MKVLLIPLGVNKIPNLALLKLAAYHKNQGDEVSIDESEPDKVYISSPFQMYNCHIDYQKRFPDAEIEYGGYGFNNRLLPENIEHMMPDYSFIPELAKLIEDEKVRENYYKGDYSLGYTTRGCIRRCIKPPCFVWKTEGAFRRHAHISEFHNPEHKKIMLLDNNILADKAWFKLTAEYIISNNLKLMEHTGFDIRLMDEEIAEIISRIRFHKNMIHVALDNTHILPEFAEKISLILQYRKGRYVTVYCYEKDDFPDLRRRVEFVRECGCLPFVMPDVNATEEIKRYTRFINKSIDKACSWEEYQESGWRKNTKKKVEKNGTNLSGYT